MLGIKLKQQHHLCTNSVMDDRKKCTSINRMAIGWNESLQEVTLRKNNSDERIGLTVSYSSGNGSGSGSDDADTCTEVYISDIMENSVAARDGRLRQGDQILQVCNCRLRFICYYNPFLWPFYEILSIHSKMTCLFIANKICFAQFMAIKLWLNLLKISIFTRKSTPLFVASPFFSLLSIVMWKLIISGKTNRHIKFRQFFMIFMRRFSFFHYFHGGSFTLATNTRIGNSSAVQLMQSCEHKIHTRIHPTTNRSTKPMIQCGNIQPSIEKKG